MYGQPAQNAPVVFSACQVQFFSSRSDAIFFDSLKRWTVFCHRVNGSMEDTSVSCGSPEKKTLGTWEKCHWGKEWIGNEKLALRNWEEEKAVPDPKNQKTGLESWIFNQTSSRRKISLHNAKIYTCGSERKKKPRQTCTLLCRQERSQKIFEERVCGNRKKPSKRLPAG